MLRIGTSIICLGLLLLLQYGKITNYLYCEWQTQVVHALPDCDCVQILDGVFEEDGNTLPGISQQLTKMAEYECYENHLSNPLWITKISINQSFNLLHFASLNIEPALRPPGGS